MVVNVSMVCGLVVGCNLFKVFVERFVEGSLRIGSSALCIEREDVVEYLGGRLSVVWIAENLIFEVRYTLMGAAIFHVPVAM